LLKDVRCHFHFDENRMSVDASDDLGDGVLIHDLTFDSRFHPYMDVQFGALAAAAVWDTGASLTVVDLTFIREHASYFDEAGESAGTDATGMTIQTPMFRMSPTVIGGHTFAAHKVAGVDLSHVNTNLDMPMTLILGYNTLCQANWWFDFPRRKWAVSKPPQPQ
jgi:hypothetical protein